MFPRMLPPNTELDPDLEIMAGGRAGPPGPAPGSATAMVGSTAGASSHPKMENEPSRTMAGPVRLTMK